MIKALQYLSVDCRDWLNIALLCLEVAIWQLEMVIELDCSFLRHTECKCREGLL